MNSQRTLKEYIRQNRADLDAHIARALGRKKNPLPNDDERRLWVDGEPWVRIRYNGRELARCPFSHIRMAFQGA
jgi:hypothetical protein